MRADPRAPGWLAAPSPNPARAAAWAAAVVLHRTGLVARFARRRAARGAPLVLAFRRVVGPNATLRSEPASLVTAGAFERMLRALRDASGFLEPVTLERLDQPAGDPSDAALRLAVAVTFDDGWRELEEVALPLLTEHGIQPTVFLPAGFIGTDRLFWPERAYAAFASYERRQRARFALRHLGLPLEAGPREFVARLAEIPEGEREALLASINAPRTSDPPALLSWDGVRTLKAAGVSIGSLGMERRTMADASIEEAAAELAAASDTIARETGEAPAALAYPGGAATDAAAEAARRVGHRRAFVSGEAAAAAGPADRFHSPRRPVRETMGAGPFGGFSPSLFLCEALGLFDRPRRALEAARRAELPTTALLLALLVAAQISVVRTLVSVWLAGASEAHGLVVIPVALYLAWRRRSRWLDVPRTPSWKGALLFAVGLAGAVVATAASSQSGQFFALIVSAWGLVWARHGDRVVRTLAVPLASLLLAIPVPWGLGLALSLPLRHAASVLGVAMAQGFGAPALLEGNVIHMAEASLNVDDACSGIRSLVALVVLATLYLSAAETPPLRSILVMAALPVLTVAANALRLFATVLAVRTAGPGLAHGAFHAGLGAVTFAVALGGLTSLERLLRWRATARRPASSSPS